MHAGRNYTLKEVAFWTHRETIVFAIIATVPTVMYASLGWTWVTVPWLPIALVGTAVAFITGFKNNASYDRTWEARKVWGAIVNTSRSFTLMTLDFVTDKHAEEKAGADGLKVIHARIVHRHLAWLTALRFILRKPKIWETQLSKININYRSKNFPVDEYESDLAAQLKPLLDAGERDEALRLSNAATQLLRMQSADLRRQLEAGHIEDFRHMAMQALITDLLTQQGKCERIKNFPYPRQFATLNLFFVWIFVVLAPLGLLPEFAELGSGFVWLTIPFSMLVSWIFHTIDKIGGASENPFEGGPNDVPITALARTIEIDLREMLGEEEVPPPLGPKNHILM